MVSVARERFCCGNGIPVEPSAAIHEIDRTDIVILPELWLGPGEHLSGRDPVLIEWVRARRQGRRMRLLSVLRRSDARLGGC
jgi:hypothetical protein